MDNTSILAIIISAIVALGGAYASITARKKTSAEASQVILDSAMKLLEPLRERIDEMDKRIKKQDKEIANLYKGITILIRQIQKMNVIPEWKPTDRIDDGG